MSMTREEYFAKQEVMNNLAENGYPTYAKLLALFDLHLTNDPQAVGYMTPSEATITLNRQLDINQVSTIVRHEILHEYLSHQLKMERKLGKDAWAKRTSSQHMRSNIAGDYDISNLGYTEADKNIVRNLMLNGKSIRGLVTEDDHPDWIQLSFEEMYDKLEDEVKEKEKEMSKMFNSKYIEGWNQAMEDYKNGKLKV